MRKMEPIRAASGRSPWRKEGVYLIAGGAGGIGAELGVHLAKTARARIALLGRRPADETTAALGDRIGRAGGKAIYLQADLTDIFAVSRAVAQVREEFGPVHGVFHSALTLEDRTLVNLDERSLRGVLAPKVRGSLTLYQATAAEPLDFFVCFSSSQALTGNPGQANYAAACTFQDAFVQHLASAGAGARLAQTINWGFWGGVGRVAGESYRRQMAKLGVYSIEVEEGMAALEAAISSGCSQVAAIKASAAVLIDLGLEDAAPVLSEVGHALACPTDERSSPRAAPRHDGEGKLKHTPPIGSGTSEVAYRGVEMLDVYAATRLRLALPKCRAVLPKYQRAREALEFVLTRDAAKTSVTSDYLLARHGEFEPHVRLVNACMDSLPGILSGAIPATDVIFPGGSMSLVEGVYRPAGADIMAATIAARSRNNGSSTFRILEAGAGSGATTAAVLDALPAAGAAFEYHYTDVSPQFLRHGKTRFAGRLPGMQFGLLNIERDPGQQGFAPASFDVVFATNVVHATRRIDATLANLAKLLRPNGLLLLGEATAFNAFATVTFGLLDGWWLFEDPERRIPHTPLVSVASWKEALAHAGFRNAREVNGEDGQSVLVAEAPAPQIDIVASIQNLVASVIEVDPREIDPSLPFAEFGIDSIMAVDIATRIGESLGVSLRATDLFNYATIEQLAEHVRSVSGSLPAEAPPVQPASELGDVFDMVRPQPARETDIAVIGVSGGFPEAPDLDTLWRNLAAGRDSVREMPRDRFDVNAVFSPERNRPGKTYSKWGGFLDDVDCFDPQFFNISPREAVQMDPQQRLFLEEAWHTFEDAGYPAARVDGCRCGVFVGGGSGDYRRRLEASASVPEAFTFMGNAGSILAARISFYLNLKGPSIAIDTACSSSLMAIHLACESLRSGACDLALAGGVSVLSTASFHVSSSRAGMLSPVGRCKTFDRDADGFVPAEGVGAVLLKPLSRALADGDRIHAVIRGSASNQDGRTNGITAPSGPSQTALEREVYDRFDISPDEISLVEAHGTGTKLGDPIEVEALSDAFRHYTARKHFCALGSVKANIGHALAAAGIVGFIKILLCLKQRQIPPLAHFQQPNEHIDFASSPFILPREVRSWEGPRRAALSSFGFSGTNVHMVVEEAPAVRPAVTRHPWHLVTLSAKTEDALHQCVTRLQAWMAAHANEGQIEDISYTSLRGRNHFPVRLAVVARDRDDLGRRLLSTADSTGIPQDLAALASAYMQGGDLPWDDLAPWSAQIVSLPVTHSRKSDTRRNRSCRGTMVSACILTLPMVTAPSHRNSAS